MTALAGAQRQREVRHWGGLSLEDRGEMHRRMRDVDPALTVKAGGEAA